MLCSFDYIIILNRYSAHNIEGGGKWQNIPAFTGRFSTEHSLRGTWSLLGRLDELLLAVCGDVKKPPGSLGIQLGLISAKHPDIGHPHHL